jgi:hypothetical protein
MLHWLLTENASNGNRDEGQQRNKNKSKAKNHGSKWELCGKDRT